MIRNVLGSLMGLIGAAAAVWSPFRAWYDGRHGRDYRVQELFTAAGITDHRAALLGSLLLPSALAAALTAAGAGALLVLAAAVMRGRPGRRVRPPRTTTTPPEAYPPAERP